MEKWLLNVGVIGNLVSVLLYGSPMPTIWRIVRKGETEEFDALPYIASLLGASLWAYYGVLKPDGLPLATINGIGALFEAAYISIYIYFAAPSRRVKAGILVIILNVGFGGAMASVARFAVKEDLRLTFLGVVCACLSLLMYGSPLAVMKFVIRTKSVEYMPFYLSLFLTLNGGIWTLYSILDRDFFLGIANGIGFILGSLQLILYILYMNPKEPKHLYVAIEESPQQQSAADYSMHINS